MKPPEDALFVTLAPAAVLATVERSVNRREKRLFGILKTKKEFVGAIFDGGFEIWERQQRAVHLVGFVRPARGGSRIELRFTLAPVTRVVTMLFFALYLFGAVGLSLREPDPALSAVELLAVVLGAGALAAGFLYFARRQRGDLMAFVSSLFSETRRERG